MLVGFTVENYASFRDKCALSMVASGIREHASTNINETGYGALLKSTVIYGANAAGKSNLIKALWFMRRVVGLSSLERDLPGRNEHFRFSRSCAEKPTLFEATFITDSVQYRYGFQVLKGRIIKEWLYRKKKRESLMFERTGPSWQTINLKGPMKGNETIMKHTREDALFISMAAIFNDPLAETVVGWFKSVFILQLQSSPMATFDYMLKGEEGRQTILKYLQIADTGIEDVSFSVKDTEVEEPDAVFSAEEIAIRRIKITRKVDLKTIHPIYDNDNTRVGQVELPFADYQSEGTASLLSLLGPVLLALEEGRVVVIDEFGSRLHPNLTRYILSLFNSAEHNQKGAQLICNTHEELLLEDNIRRDQVWFVEKDDFGASELYSLHDFIDTRPTQLSRKYLLGIFGAVPRLGEVEDYD